MRRLSEWPGTPSVVDDFLRELQALRHGPLAAAELLPTRLMVAAERVLPVGGAGVSVLSRIRVPLGASNESATRAERLQSTLGEGPCLTAYRQSVPLAADERQLQTSWPIFHAQLVEQTPFRAVASFPLHAGTTRFGAVDLYVSTPRIGHVPDLLAGARELAGTIAAQLTAEPTGLPKSGGTAVQPWIEAPAARRRLQVWVAIGMLSVRGRLTSADALALLQAGAYSRNTTIDDLAEELIARRIEVEQLTG